MNISIYLASSVNGLISNRSNVPNWLSQEYGRGFVEICQRTKAVIMGRTTYDILSPDHLPLQQDGTLLVRTHGTSATPAQPNVVFTDGPPPGIVELLTARGHDEAVIIGGTQAVSDFVKAGLVNQMYLVVEPVLFGAGLPILRDVDVDHQLTLLDVRKLGPNTVQLHYRLLHQ